MLMNGIIHFNTDSLGSRLLQKGGCGSGLFAQWWTLMQHSYTFSSQQHDSQHGGCAPWDTGLSGAKGAEICDTDLLDTALNKWLLLPIPDENYQSSKCCVETLARRLKEE